MTSSASSEEKHPRPDHKPRRGFNPLKVVAPVIVVLAAISWYVNWYGSQVSALRYCGNRQETVIKLERVLTQSKPAGDGPHRSYLVAAKLLFLLPRRSNETLKAYLKRVDDYLRGACRPFVAP